MLNDNLATVLAYYDAINQNNPSKAAQKLADDVKIISPLAIKTGKHDVVEALKGFCSALNSITIPIANEKVGNNLVFTIAQNNGITQL